MVWNWFLRFIVTVAIHPAIPCPTFMVHLSERTCIDELPFPNEGAEPPLLGVSGQPETYLNLRGVTWDAEGLCKEQGKRVCTWQEWQNACEGTPDDQCPGLSMYIKPHWKKVEARDFDEMDRLDQHSDFRDYPDCRSKVGARMMGNIEEWVRYGDSYAFTRGFWSREGGCHGIVVSHSPSWHDYATGVRCCYDL